MSKRRTVNQRDIQREAARAVRAARKSGGVANHDVVEMGDRPATRADCMPGPRPCPWVGCRHHLFLEVSRHGSLTFPHGDTVEDLEKMPDTCALDVAQRGDHGVRSIKHLVAMSDFGTRLVLNRALATLSQRRKLAELSPCGPQTLWEEGVSRAHVVKRRSLTVEALRQFLDSPPEQKEGAP